MRTLTSLALVAMLAVAASTASAYTTDPVAPDGHPAGHGWIQLSDYDYIDSGAYAGSYRYVYDLYNDSSTYLRQANMYFDASGVLNDTGSGRVAHVWTAEAAGKPRAFGGYIDHNRFPSYWVTKPDFTQGWEQPKDVLDLQSSNQYSADARPTAPNQSWYLDNEWYDGGEYVGGGIFSFRDGVFNDTGIYWNSDNGLLVGARFSPGLAMTFVIYHESPVGDNNIAFAINQGVGGFVDGPMVLVNTDRIGDLILSDGTAGTDDVIDAADIAELARAIRLGLTDAKYDVDGIGGVDAADLAFLVSDLVDTTIVDLGEEFGFLTGTFFADFNLDGKVSILDLGTLGDGYNQAGDWATGDANGDGLVSILDLGVLGDNYNQSIPGAIPEPATMSLLAIGAVALIRRRRRA